MTVTVSDSDWQPGTDLETDNLAFTSISGNLIWTELMVKEKNYFENDHFANLKT